MMENNISRDGNHSIVKVIILSGQSYYLEIFPPAPCESYRAENRFIHSSYKIQEGEDSGCFFAAVNGRPVAHSAELKEPSVRTYHVDE